MYDKGGAEMSIKHHNSSSFYVFDFLIYTVIIVMSINFIGNLDLHNKDVGVIFTFLLIGLMSFIGIIKCEDNISVYRVMHIFNYIFLFMAPLQQYSKSTILWKQNGLNLIYENMDYWRANIAIIIAIITMEIGYQVKLKRNSQKTLSCDLTLTNAALLTMLILSTICLLMLFATNNVKADTMIVKTASINDQIVNILKYIPVSSLLIYLMSRKNTQIKHQNLYLLLMIAEVGMIFSPFWGSMPRFILFGTYVVFCAFLFADAKYKSIYFFAMFIGFCYMFSSMKFTKTYQFSFDTVNFIHVDFDAYQMLMACMKYVNQKGVFWGLNLLSSIMFIIPRSIVKWKMEATGGIVVSEFHSWFKNVSMPYIGELYAAFRWTGIVVFGFLSGIGMRILSTWKNEKNFLKNGVFYITTGMTIYIMRGALLAAASYTLGLILTFYLTYKVCSYMNRKN